MKRIIIMLAGLLATASLAASSEVKHIAASEGAKSSFAIFVDSATWAECSESIGSYRAMLEQEGLATHIYVSAWERPEDVKEIILNLSCSEPLEGVVFVGEIPVVRVSGAQYMTTAFKMNESLYTREESSVPTDRFYDDFSLSFDYVDCDSTAFYYTLNGNGSQRLQQDIYSARIRVPASMDDPYGRYNRYFESVVKAHKQANALDNVVFYQGSSYNSDCLTHWREKPLLWREFFPAAFKKASTNKFLNYRYGRDIMWELFQEMQRKDVDLMQFSEHGDPGIQFITGSEEGNSLERDLQLLRSGLRRYWRHYRGSEVEGEFLEECLSDYGTAARFFTDSLLAEDYRIDSLETRLNNLDLERIEALKTGPRVMIFNACYNGSFHSSEGYVAASHLFNGGSCIVAQGNTVNVLQDKYEDELLGVLSAGVRIGYWQKGLHYLESHLLGDPTFRFSVTDAEFVEAYESSICNVSYWREELYLSDNALHRVGAIKRLYEAGEMSSEELLRVLLIDPSAMVRLEALHLSSLIADNNTTTTILYALSDPCERIVRLAVQMAVKVGDPQLKAALQHLSFTDNDMQRALFIASDAIQVMSPDDKENVKFIRDIREGSEKAKVAAIRFQRNYPLHFAVGDLLPLLTSEGMSPETKLCLAEALGWFDRSYRRYEIIEGISAMDLGSLDPALAAELRKTLKRLTR